MQARLLLVAYLGIVGCGQPTDSEVSANTSTAALPGVYAGQFPCVNCPAISTRLWLRADGRYFISQRYLPDENGDEMIVYGLGRWHRGEADRTVVLAGDGPPRTFAWPDPETLIMRTDSELEHRLSRDPESPDFTARISMTGMMRNAGKNSVFEECLTGLEAPVGKGGDYARFLHQYRSVAAGGEEVFVEFEGRFSWFPGGAPESVTIDRLVTIRKKDSCRPAD
jgi:hypothetical protein